MKVVLRQVVLAGQRLEPLKVLLRQLTGVLVERLTRRLVVVRVVHAARDRSAARQVFAMAEGTPNTS